MKTNTHFFLSYFAQFFLQREMFQIKVVEKTKHLFLITLIYLNSCRLWDNAEKSGTARRATDSNIVRRMRISCWITKATDTHSEYFNTLCFSTATMVARKRLNVQYIVCLFFMFSDTEK
jgi:hypothetical protein